MKHLPFNPTPEQRANLERLAAHLDLGVTNLEFDMKYFQVDGDGEDIEYAHVCGTVGCAIGHGPSLGIEAIQGEDWWAYSSRVFGTDIAEDAGSWMFSSAWGDYDVDNTPRGAAARIRYALKHGIPENFRNQSYGDERLCYTVAEFSEHVVKPKVDA